MTAGLARFLWELKQGIRAFNLPYDSVMKKLFLALLALIVVANPLFPQKSAKKSVFGANAGLSIPYKEFSRNTWGFYSGFAVPGPNIEAEFLLPHVAHMGSHFSIIRNSKSWPMKKVGQKNAMESAGYNIVHVGEGGFKTLD